jgi:hypothetical protein
MARKSNKTQQAKAVTQPEANSEKVEQPDTAAQSAPETGSPDQPEANNQPEADPEKLEQPEAGSPSEDGTESPDQSDATAQPEANSEAGTADDKGKDSSGKAGEPSKKSSAKSTGGMVDAILKTRHCRGGICKEAGETMRMTRGEYERLKKYGRVE